MAASGARDGLAALGRFTRAVEGALRPTVRIAGRPISTFQLCGVAAFFAATGAAFVLGVRLGLSAGVLAVLAALGVGTFFAVVLVTRAILGEERLVYYHHELAILAVTALVVALLGRPVLAYLDVAVVGLGVFLAFGRIGCSMVGCCHGAPHPAGLRYGVAHADAGFPGWFVGVPLLPVQLMESLAVSALTLVSATRLWVGGPPPGAVMASQLVAYACLRFILELGRGDVERPIRAGFSEAQWISMATALAIVAAEISGQMPVSTHDVSMTAVLVVAVAAVVSRRRKRGFGHRLLAPHHVSELARALSLADGAVAAAAPSAVPVFTTTLGVRISYSRVAGGASVYTISGVEVAAARALSSLLLLLRPSPGAVELLERRPRVFQVLVLEATRPAAQARPGTKRTTPSRAG